MAFSLLGSLFSRLSHLDPGPIAPGAAFLTLVLGTVAAFEPYVRSVGSRAYWGLAAVLLLGASVELTGVATGLPFGRYGYTDRWWPTVHLPSIGPFPVQVPIAWLLMVGASTLAVLGQGGQPLWRSAVAAGTLCAGLDLVMEPVMAGPLDYWRWLEKGPLPGGAPVLNLLGWFATSAIGAAIVLSLGARNVAGRREPQVVLAAHLLLTLGIGAILSL